MFRLSRSAGSYSLLGGAVLLLGPSCLSAFAQTAAKLPKPAPASLLQAELIAPLDLTHVHPGSTLYARLDIAWSDPSCSLIAGGVIKGHVAALTKRSRSEKTSSLQLVFDSADCRNRPPAPPHFALLALVGPVASDSHEGQSGVSEGPPLSNDLPLTIGGAGGGGIRNAAAASAITDTFVLPARNLPAQILPGQVIDVPRTHIDTAADGASIITAYRKDVRLEAGTTLVLVPEAVAIARVAPAVTAAAPSRPTVSPTNSSSGSVLDTPKSPPEPPDITDICSGACTSVAAHTDSAMALSLSRAAGSISLNPFGYLPASDRELPHFTQDTAVVYLGAGRVLCTFDPHQLRGRTEIDGESSRTIRAVLVNTADFSVQRVFDWRVRGNNQYLWQLSSGHLLVHLGRELKEFDTGLNPLRSIHLNGRVAWVVASPSGNHIAVGTIRERYSFAFRNEMEQSLPETPEEDIELRVFDDHLQQLMSVIRSSRTPPPVLSDAGEERVQHDAGGRWRISEIDWQRQDRTLALVRSACRPTLSAPEHGLIFMVGCTSTGARWYRMLREDGHPLLKGDLPSNGIEPNAQASGNAFAVRTVEALRPMSVGQPFRPSDLKHERIAVYSSSDGARRSAVATEDFAVAEQGYALSPDGAQLALLGRDSLHFYNIPQKTR